MNLMKRSFSVMLMLVLLVSVFTGISAFAEDSTSTRWADAADEIDKYLDAAFESYLDGDAKTAYDNVSNAYFRVYETTGFERQTMSYVSGNRKNAVEMQFSTCKAAVKKDNTDLETKVKVRSALAKLKSMIREDGNKLAALQGGVQSETKYYLRGELVSSDPYADFSADPNAAAKYENWYEAATLVKELLDTAYMGYLDKDFEAAEDNINTAYYTVYEESGLNHAIYTDLSLKDRQKMDGHFTALHNLVASAAEKYQKNKYRTSTDSAKNDILKMAKALDTKEEEAKAAEAAAAAEALAGEPEAESTKQSDPRLLTFLGAFGIIVREGLEAILVIAGMIAYLVKSGNQKTLRNVYIGSILGIVASFIAAWLLSYLKRVWTGRRTEPGGHRGHHGPDRGLRALLREQLDDLEIRSGILEPLHRRQGALLRGDRQQLCPGLHRVPQRLPRGRRSGALLSADALRRQSRHGLGRIRRRLRAAGVCLPRHHEALHPPADQGLLHRDQHPDGGHVRQLPGQRHQGTGRRQCLRPEHERAGHPGERRDSDLRHLSLA